MAAVNEAHNGSRLLWHPLGISTLKLSCCTQRSGWTSLLSSMLFVKGGASRSQLWSSYVPHRRRSLEAVFTVNTRTSHCQSRADADVFSPPKSCCSRIPQRSEGWNVRCVARLSRHLEKLASRFHSLRTVFVVLDCRILLGCFVRSSCFASSFSSSRRYALDHSCFCS